MSTAHDFDGDDAGPSGDGPAHVNELAESAMKALPRVFVRLALYPPMQAVWALAMALSYGVDAGVFAIGDRAHMALGLLSVPVIGVAGFFTIRDYVLVPMFLLPAVRVPPLSDAGRARVRTCMCTTVQHQCTCACARPVLASQRVCSYYAGHAPSWAPDFIADRGRPCPYQLGAVQRAASALMQHSQSPLHTVLGTMHLHAACASLCALALILLSHTRALTGSVTQVCTDPLTAISLTRHARFFGCGRFRC